MTFEDFKNMLSGCFQVSGVNGIALATITLSDVQTALAIILTFVTIVANVVIIRNNVKNKKNEP